jgi:hypothetical protein
MRHQTDTRVLVDDQLKAVGWEADSRALTHSSGARPEKGKNRAIAEWPTATGPADHVLFIGLMPVATVEAKRKNIDVSGLLAQAKRYSKGFELTADMTSSGNAWDEYQLPCRSEAGSKTLRLTSSTRMAGAGLLLSDTVGTVGWIVTEIFQASASGKIVRHHGSATNR